MSQRAKWECALFAVLFVGGTAARLWFRDLPNFAPVAAIALFAGLLFRRPLVAICLPAAIMAASDSVIGGYDPRMMALVYLSLVFPVLLRGPLKNWVAERPQSMSALWGRIAGLLSCSLAASIVFFLVTNFGCWLWFESYAASWQGLVTCYTAALPFFRYTLLGDASFSLALCAGYWVYQMRALRSAELAPVRL